MGWVWDLDIPRDEKFILLAYADHADHDGNNVFPAIASVALKTGYSERSVQRITRKIEERGLLISKGVNQRYQTNQYYIPIPGGDKTTPPTDGGVTNGTNGGDNLSQRGDIAVSPEPSLTVNKPSLVNAIAMWKELFPSKPQPRPTTGTIKTKWKTRIKDNYFIENYHRALQMASMNKGLVKKSWFNFRWVIHNDINYQKLIDGEFAWMNKGNKDSDPNTIANRPAVEWK